MLSNKYRVFFSHVYKLQGIFIQCIPQNMSV